MFAVVQSPIVTDSLQTHGLQHARPPLSFTIYQSLLKIMSIASVMPSSYLSSSNALFFCPQSFPASGTFPLSHLYASDDWNTGASASACVLPVNILVDLPWDWLICSPCCLRDFQESSLAPQFAGISSLVFCLLYSPALTTICNHWEAHSLDYMDLCWQSYVCFSTHYLGFS